MQLVKPLFIYSNTKVQDDTGSTCQNICTEVRLNTPTFPFIDVQLSWKKNNYLLPFPCPFVPVIGCLVLSCL